MKLTYFSFENGQTATASQIDHWSDLPELPYHLGLAKSRSSLVLVGGASKMDSHTFSRLEQVFTEILAPMAQHLNLTVLDGGTDCGVMQLMGQARHHIGGTFPLVGVCAIATVIQPHGTPPPSEDAAALEPHHSHFVLVPGDTWGAESPWLAKLATIIAAGEPACTLVSNGGEITWQDVGCSIDERRPTIVLDGSGRTTDQLAAAPKGHPSDPRAQPLLTSGYLSRLSLNEELEQVQTYLYHLLAPQKTHPSSQAEL